MSSIRQKITYGFYAFAAIIGLLAALAYVDLYYLEQRIIEDEIVAGFLDTTLEMRRNEKNYFLYGTEADYLETQQYATRARELLDTHPHAFLNYSDPESLQRLRDTLASFQARFARYRDTPSASKAGRTRLEEEIRNIGREATLVAGTMAKAERADMRAAMKSSQLMLAFSVGVMAVFGIIVGQILSRRVVGPLRMLEAAMQPIAQGRFNKLDIPVRDREIVSFQKAFNRMLHEHDLRLQHLVQSEKLASLGTLVSGVAHELNNPLANISSSCQILLEELDAKPGDHRHELLRQIDEQTERARNTVRALLDFSRQSEFQTADTPLRPLVEQTGRFLKGQIASGVAIVNEVPEDLVAEVDRRKLQQALLNLIKNALDALGGKGRVTIRAKRYAAGETPNIESVHVHGTDRCDSDAETILLSVEDNGPGIPPEILARVFDPFFTTRDVGQGSGLGLYIVAEIVQQHNGCIGVVSNVNAGTTFYIKLPRTQSATESGVVV